MDRDTACIVQFENDQTRALVQQGWTLDVIDTDIWRGTIDGWVPQARYVVRGRRRAKTKGTYGTMACADTPEQAVAAFVRRIAEIDMQGLD